jgi:hypothetical protein
MGEEMQVRSEIISDEELRKQKIPRMRQAALHPTCSTKP